MVISEIVLAKWKILERTKMKYFVQEIRNCSNVVIQLIH